MDGYFSRYFRGYNISLSFLQEIDEGESNLGQNSERVGGDGLSES